MTFRATAKTFDVSVGSLRKRISSSVGIAGMIGPPTVLTTDEENSVEDTLKFAKIQVSFIARNSAKY